MNSKYTHGLELSVFHERRDHVYFAWPHNSPSTVSSREIGLQSILIVHRSHICEFAYSLHSTPKSVFVALLSLLTDMHTCRQERTLSCPTHVFLARRKYLFIGSVSLVHKKMFFSLDTWCHFLCLFVLSAGAYSVSQDAYM